MPENSVYFPYWIVTRCYEFVQVIINAVGTGFQEGDTLSFSSGTAEAKVAVVNGGIAPETGSVAVHVELESGTITGSGSGDLLLEDAIDGGAGGKLLDSTSQEVENEIRFELENEVGHLLAEDDDSEVSDTFFIIRTSPSLNPVTFTSDIEATVLFTAEPVSAAELATNN